MSVWIWPWVTVKVCEPVDAVTVIVPERSPPVAAVTEYPRAVVPDGPLDEDAETVSHGLPEVTAAVHAELLVTLKE